MGYLESVHYLAERMIYQIKLLQPSEAHPVNHHGFTAATNGLKLTVSFLKITNNCPELDSVYVDDIDGDEKISLDLFRLDKD